MSRRFAVSLSAALAAVLSASVFAAGNMKCSKCGAVCPAGWSICQKCKNEADRALREENRRKRLAETEEAKRRKKAEAEEAKLRKLAEQGVSAQAPAEAAPAAAPSGPAPAAAPLAGLFSVKFDDAVEPPRFMKRFAKVDGREEPYHVFVPAKPFRNFADYSVKADPVTGKVLSITAHRRFTAEKGLEAKHASFAEFEACLALLKKKFGREMPVTEDSLARRKCVMKFVSADGVTTHALSITLARDMDALIADRVSGDPDAVEQNIDLVYDLTIKATDCVAALREKLAKEREKSAREAADLDAL